MLSDAIWLQENQTNREDRCRYRKYTTIDNAKLVSDPDSDPNDGVGELSTQYNSTIAELIDSHAPLITRVIIIRPKTPWYNSELSDASDNSGELNGGGDTRGY